MAGLLVGVVGPSGVGKDSVMVAMCAARPDIFLVRRVITRPPEASGEEFDGVDLTEFETRAAAGEFVLQWPAHGLRYGIPKTETDKARAGRTGLINLSRAVLGEAEALFSGFVTLNLTAPRSLLAARLKARGREDAANIDARLARADFALPEGLSRVIHLENAGALSDTAVRAIAALEAHQRESA